MQTFEIQYVGRYGEHKEHYTEIIKARTEKSALNKFAKTYNLKANDITNDTWWDNEWLMELRNIKQVTEHACLNCNGTGKIFTK
ncbi:MAG: hypothetical protein EAZ06_05915 [Cytophagales bacterium]|nr:MAG: hypothetical protein EAZ06_05915 [Cytophagales bacterium]